MATEPPSDRCGYVNDSGWGKYHCCWREPWRERDRCVWHADVDGKPTADIRTALSELDSLDRTDRSIERLDGAILSGVTLDGSISFADCHLPGADFRGTGPRWGDYPELERRWATRTDRTVETPSFEGADVKGADFSGADLPSTTFVGADLDGATFVGTGLADGRFDDAELDGAIFRNAFLGGASLRGAVLPEADFTNARLMSAELDRATAERAIFHQADLSGASLEGALLYAAVLSSVRLNGTTEFGPRCIYDSASPYYPPDADTDSHVRQFDEDPVAKAAWVYRRLAALHDENAMVERARWYHVRRAEILRATYWRNWDNFEDVDRPRDLVGTWNLPKALVYELNRWTSRHGNSPYRVVGLSVLTVGVSAVLYLFAGVKSSGGGVISWAKALDASSGGVATAADLLVALGDGLYFSTVTFTTLGYGDIRPLGWAKWVSTVESFLGALLMAMLVFVLGRRVS